MAEHGRRRHLVRALRQPCNFDDELGSRSSLPSSPVTLPGNRTGPCLRSARGHWQLPATPPTKAPVVIRCRILIQPLACPGGTGPDSGLAAPSMPASPNERIQPLPGVLAVWCGRNEPSATPDPPAARQAPDAAASRAVDGLIIATDLAQCNCSIAVFLPVVSLVPLATGLAWGVSPVGTQTPRSRRGSGLFLFCEKAQ